MDGMAHLVSLSRLEFSGLEEPQSGWDAAAWCSLSMSPGSTTSPALFLQSLSTPCLGTNAASRSGCFTPAARAGCWTLWSRSFAWR